MKNKTQRGRYIKEMGWPITLLLIPIFSGDISRPGSIFEGYIFRTGNTNLVH